MPASNVGSRPEKAPCRATLPSTTDIKYCRLLFNIAVSRRPFPTQRAHHTSAVKENQTHLTWINPVHPEYDTGYFPDLPLHCSTINDIFIRTQGYYSNCGFAIHAKEIGRETYSGVGRLWSANITGCRNRICGPQLTIPASSLVLVTYQDLGRPAPGQVALPIIRRAVT